jgi:hypothetical protein
MVELAVHLDASRLLVQRRFLSSRRLQDIRTEGPDRGFEARGWAGLLEALPSEFSRRPATRVYLGSEFCPLLASSERELARAVDAARASSLDVTVVLGPVRQTAADETTARMGRLSARIPSLEVVANDWGTLAELSRLGVVPVAGRLLFRMKRLPRFSPQTRPAPQTPRWRSVLAAQMKEFSRCPADIPWFARLLGGARVSRLDTEIVPQGVRLQRRSAVKLSLLLPWTYITGGGRCPVSGQPGPGQPQRCGRACRQSWIEPRFPYSTWPLVQVGNTVFSSMSSLLKDYFGRRIYDRYILEPRLPL